MYKPEILSELESRIDYKFQNRRLLETALTHSSYANETGDGDVESYERLEFLGDAITGFETALLIYEETPYLTEGEMTVIRAALVRTEELAKTARSIGLGKYIRLGLGADKTDVRENDSVLEDVFEALTAAVFLDGGTEAARRLIRCLFSDKVSGEAESSPGKRLYIDYKSRLQVELQKNGATDIHYELLEESGPDHDKWFRVSVLSGDKVLGTGEGKTKKLAEKMAAKKALEVLRCI